MLSHLESFPGNCRVVQHIICVSPIFSIRRPVGFPDMPALPVQLASPHQPRPSVQCTCRACRSGSWVVGGGKGQSAAGMPFQGCLSSSSAQRYCRSKVRPLQSETWCRAIQEAGVRGVRGVSRATSIGGGESLCCQGAVSRGGGAEESQGVGKHSKGTRLQFSQCLQCLNCKRAKQDKKVRH